MEAWEKKTGGKLLAIPHNGNLSNGRMFALHTFLGNPLTREYDRLRGQTLQGPDAEGSPHDHPGARLHLAHLVHLGRDVRQGRFARLLREPLLHFLLLGAALFGLFHGVSGRAGGDHRIFITAGQIQSLAETFHLTWQRPPTPQELDALVADDSRVLTFRDLGRQVPGPTCFVNNYARLPSRRSRAPNPKGAATRCL
jgi:hypothetical protein